MKILSQKGISLIEITIAMMVLSIVVVGTFSALFSVNVGIEDDTIGIHTNQQIKAFYLSQQIMEYKEVYEMTCEESCDDLIYCQFDNLNYNSFSKEDNICKINITDGNKNWLFNFEIIN